MGTRLYVGNLSFEATVESVRTAFSAVGAVDDVHLVKDRETGRPRGFGFVTMGSEHDAQEAIKQMNGAMLEGRPLRVNEAEERQRPAGGGFGGGGGGFRGGGGGERRGGGDRGSRRGDRNNRW